MIIFINNPKKNFFIHLSGEKIYQKNLDLSHTTKYEFLTSYQNLEKTVDPIPRKHLDCQKKGQIYGKTLFHRTLPATAGGPIIVFNNIKI